MIFKKRAPSKITFVFNGHKTVYFNQKKARLTYNSLIFKSNGKDQLKNNSIESHAEIYRIYLILNVIIKPIMCIFRKCFLLLVMVTILSVAKGMDLLELIEKNQMHSTAGLSITKSNDVEDGDSNINSKEPSLNKKTSSLSTSSYSLLQEVDSDNPLIDFLYHDIIRNEPIEESLWVYRTRLGIKILSGLYGITAGVPYIGSSWEAGQGNIFLSVAFATGNIVSYGGATAWATLKLTKFLDPISSRERKLLYSDKSCNITKHIFCNILGVLASIPSTYVAYKYNPKNLKYLAIPGFLTSYMFSTLGYYELAKPKSTLKRLFSKFEKKNEINKISVKIKENLIHQAQDHLIPLILKNDTNNQHYLTDEITSLDKIFSVKNFIKNLLSSKYSLNSMEPLEISEKEYLRKIAQASSLLLPLSGTIVNYLITYKAINMLTNSSFVSSCFSIGAVVPNFMLDVLSTTTTIGSLFDVIYSKVKDRKTPNFTSTFYPLISFVIPPISLMLASLSASGTWYISYDAIYHSDLKSLVYVLPTIAFILNVLFESFSNRDLFHETINYYSTLKKDNIGEKVNKINKLEKFIEVIYDCDPSILYNFWTFFDLFNEAGFESSQNSDLDTRESDSNRML